MVAVGEPLQVLIEASALPRYRRALTGLLASKDILVWTPDEAAEWAAVPQALVTTALNEGVVLYKLED